MDYTPLEDTEELPTLTVEGFEETEVSEAKLTHITETLDHYAVYQVYPAKELTGKKVVDTRWVITRNPNGSLKARLTGRDYKWREPGREDVHAAMSQPHNARLVDFLALKDDDRPDDPLTSFEIDLVGAYYQVEQDEEKCKNSRRARSCLMATDAFVRGKYARFKRPCLKGPDSTIVAAPLKLLTVALTVMQANADSGQCESFWCPEPVHVYECSAFHVGWAAIASTVLVVSIMWKMVSMLGRPRGDRRQASSTSTQTMRCTRSMATQSPTTYQLNRTVPRFTVLGDAVHGAWEETRS